MLVVNLLAPLSLLLLGVCARASRDERPPWTLPKPFVLHVDARKGSVFHRDGTKLAPYNQTYYFNQLIDHTNPGLGTFRQRYWHTYEFYQPGGPIVMLAPGEGDASGSIGYLTNKTINGLIAQELNGSAVVLEHRFFGQSNPYSDLSVESFRVHTVQQAIDDLVYFAQNVNLPMPGGDQVRPDKAPWVLVGGSYSGALTSYTMTNHPGVFAAGYASSAVVQAIVDFWGYFEPIREYMPANCSTDVQAVIGHVDSVLESNNATAINALKETFGLPLNHGDDFAAALQRNLFDWQLLQPDNDSDQLFYQFCDALEVKDGVSAPASGWGLDHALEAWGSYWKTTYYALVCGTDAVETCLGTYDSSAPYWTNTTVNQWERSWDWMVCNQFGFWQDGQASPGTIVSRFVTPIYTERQCGYRFPGVFPNDTAAPDADDLNRAYGGWNTDVKHVVFANGLRDPWREATVAAAESTNVGSDLQPHLLSDGFHCSDMIIREGYASAQVKEVQDTALMYIRQWVSQWTPGA